MSEPKIRMLPNPNTGGGSYKQGGLTKTVAVNTYSDIPPDMARQMMGWISLGHVGPSTARPTNARGGDHFIDTTLSAVIFYDGAGSWRDPFTGAVA